MQVKTKKIYAGAVRRRDSRFDGAFLYGVKTTGVYCRPVCPARPKLRNVEFFAGPREAEKKGYRPCKRCRPDVAPFSAAWVGRAAVVRRALKKIDASSSGEPSEKLATSCGVSARHLRRLFVAELGKSPKRILLERRLDRALRLLRTDGAPVTEIAFASGFQSIRRFNDAFKKRFGMSPSQVRSNKRKRL